MADSERSVREVETTDEPIENGRVRREAVSERTAAPSSIVAQRVVWYIVGFIVAFLVLRLVLQLLGANQGNGFVDFIYSVSGVFAAPFFGMFNYQPSYGASFFEVSTLVAIVIYVLVGWGLAKLFTLGSTRTDV